MSASGRRAAGLDAPERRPSCCSPPSGGLPPASSPPRLRFRPPAAADGAHDASWTPRASSREGTVLAAGRLLRVGAARKSVAERLRFSWSSPGGRGAVAPGRRGAPRPVRPVGPPAAAVRRDFSQHRRRPVFRDEDLACRKRAARAALLRLRAEPRAPLFLSDLRLVRPDPARARRWSFSFDTTRRDAVGFGGCPDPSTPHLDAILRDAWKAGRAYAPASWTIPSVASLLTGRVPAAHRGLRRLAARRSRPAIPTLADDFRRAGWSTAAFIANPTLRARERIRRRVSRRSSRRRTTAPRSRCPAAETMRARPVAGSQRIAASPSFSVIHLLDPHDPVPAPRPAAREDPVRSGLPRRLSSATR